MYINVHHHQYQQGLCLCPMLMTMGTRMETLLTYTTLCPGWFNLILIVIVALIIIVVVIIVIIVIVILFYFDLQFSGYYMTFFVMF
jgi:hypothetical protein